MCKFKLNTKEELNHFVTFLTAGNASFKLLVYETNFRRSYYVKRQRGENFFYVKVKDGKNWVYVGILSHTRKDGFCLHITAASKFDSKHPVVENFRKSITSKINSNKPMGTEVGIWHMGKCGRCGTRLEDPASVERGIGPVCLKLMEESK